MSLIGSVLLAWNCQNYKVPYNSVAVQNCSLAGKSFHSRVHLGIFLPRIDRPALVNFPKTIFRVTAPSRESHPLRVVTLAHGKPVTIDQRNSAQSCTMEL